MTNGTLHRIEKKLKAGKTTLLQLHQNDGKNASFIFDEKYNFDFSVFQMVLSWNLSHHMDFQEN